MKVLALFALTFGLSACVSQQIAEEPTAPVRSDPAPATTIEDLIFPFYTIDSAEIGAEVPSPGNGALLGYEPDEFGNYRAIVEVSIPYYYFGMERSLSVSYVVGGLGSPARSPGPITASESVGVAADIIYFSARSDSLDPWLVRTTDSVAFYAGSWWFLPRWIEPGYTQFLSFRQIDSFLDLAEEYIAFYRPLADEGADFSFQYIGDRDRIRAPLRLSEYPVPADRTSIVERTEMQFYGGTGAIQYEQTIGEIEGYSVVLYWQRGFNDYLRDEYVLDEPIWIYASLYAMDNVNNKLVVFVRDFSVEADEEIIARTTLLLQERREAGYWELP